MIISEKRMYIRETETKPNTYACVVLVVMMLIVIASWGLNEAGLFRVGQPEMRVGSILALLSAGIPVICFRLDKRLIANPKSKYFVMAASILVTLSLTTLMTFHTTIMLLYPMFVGMLYSSKPLGKMAVGGSLLCTVLSPILAYAIGAWESDFFAELIRIGTNGTVTIAGAHPQVLAESVGKILRYVVFPHVMLAGACAVLMFYVIKLGADHVENRMKLSGISRHDALTGLYNQGAYKSLLEDTGADCPVGVIFFDVNGLKLLNDSRGHEYGDLLLKRCGESIANVCRKDEEGGFRLGGDEFLIILENATEEDVQKKLAEWQLALERVNEQNRAEGNGIECSMAAGCAHGRMKDLQSLVSEADARMYENKAAYKAKLKAEGKAQG